MMNLLTIFAKGTAARFHGKVILDKPNDNPVVTSGKQTLKKLTKEQVENIIRKDGAFYGYLAGSNISPRHFLKGWKLALKFEAHGIMQLDKRLDDFERWMKENTPEFGEYAQFYQIIESSENHEAEYK